MGLFDNNKLEYSKLTREFRTYMIKAFKGQSYNFTCVVPTDVSVYYLPEKMKRNHLTKKDNIVFRILINTKLDNDPEYKNKPVKSTNTPKGPMSISDAVSDMARSYAYDCKEYKKVVEEVARKFLEKSRFKYAKRIEINVQFCGDLGKYIEGL